MSTRAAWMQALLLLMGCASAVAQVSIPKDLDGWESWALDGEEFRRCPFFANTHGGSEHERVCALPGRLDLVVNQNGAHFAQSWTTFAETWVPLPGGATSWPAHVMLNGAPAAVVERGGAPQIRVSTGSFTIAGEFTWTQRPESLPLPAEVGLIALTIDGQRQDLIDRPEGALWLGAKRAVEAPEQLDLQVYRLLSDRLPVTLESRLLLQVAGDAREVKLPGAMPPGFQPMSLDGELATRLDADGTLRVQVRAGSWTVSLLARAADDLKSIQIPAPGPAWPKQEIWSFSGDERLRVAGLEGADGIDPAQTNVPAEWRAYPSYRIVPGKTSLTIVERSRGLSLQAVNHLNLYRELYLDFRHAGFTMVDRVSGQLRSGWRLDMRPPYRLLSATSEGKNLLVTSFEGDLSGVELRRPTVDLTAIGRTDRAAGPLPASGWTERFDRVTGVLNLPPGHRLLAAFGADASPGAWIEQWGLLDLFLMLLAAVVALRLFGVGFALVTLVAIALVHQDDNSLVIWVLLCLLSATAFRAIPAGRGQVLAKWIRNLALAILLLRLIPFAVSQWRFAMFPQLADPGGYVHEGSVENPYGLGAVVNEGLFGRAKKSPAPPPLAAPPSPMGAPAPPPKAESNAPAADAVSSNLQEVIVSGARRSRGELGATNEEYAPGAQLQAGPGVPHWRYVQYPFNWTGPVDAAQSVHFIILRPWLVASWRLLGVVLLAVLFSRLVRGSFDFRTLTRWFRKDTGAAAAAVLALTVLVLAPDAAHASATPDPRLLDQLKSRLERPAKCVPDCAAIMSAHVTYTLSSFAITLDYAALASVAVPLPIVGQNFDPDAITIDGAAGRGAYRASDGRLWVPLSAGAHAVIVSGRLPSLDAIDVQFLEVPHSVSVSGQGWDASGVNEGRLLGNTLSLARRRNAGQPLAATASSTLLPYVRLHREFTLGVDWSVMTSAERLAPDKGGFTLELPLLPGESVLSNGVAIRDGNHVLASFDSDASEFVWKSALARTASLVLTAAANQPFSEVWVFNVSPLWHVDFAGLPAVMPEDAGGEDWRFEYYPHPGETLKVEVKRPAAESGPTLAIDAATLSYAVGKRSSGAVLEFNYRSTQGGLHSIQLPPGARLMSVTSDERPVAVQSHAEQLPLTLLPGAHRIKVDWQFDAGIGVLMRLPDLDLKAASGNITTHLGLPGDRWILYAHGSGVGPAILYWGELLLFVILALTLGRQADLPLRPQEWLLLGLGLSTFSWSVLLLFVAWMLALRWRERLTAERLTARPFNLLQTALFVLSFAALLALVLAIPHGLLATPDMRIAGVGEYGNELEWFDDQASGVLRAPWILSVSLWWYKAAMLLWALWLAFALARWLPIAWRALGAGGFWRRPPAPPPAPLKEA